MITPANLWADIGHNMNKICLVGRYFSDANFSMSQLWSKILSPIKLVLNYILNKKMPKKKASYIDNF